MVHFYYLQYVYNNRVAIPIPLRADLSMHNHSKEFVTVQEIKRHHRMVELVISPVRFEFRQDLWTLKADFHDRPGLIGEISEFLKQYNMQVIRLSTHLINGDIFSIQVSMNATWFVDQASHEFSTRVNDEFIRDYFRDAFYAAFVNEVVFNEKLEKPVIQITVNDQLASSVAADKGRYELPVFDSHVHMVDPLMNVINRHLGKRNMKPGRQLRASVVSDPSNALCRVYLFLEDTGIVHVRIRSNKNSDALTHVSRLLNQKGFNIVQCFVRSFVGSDNKECLLIDCILCLSGKLHKRFSSDDEVTRELIMKPFGEESENKKYHNWEVTVARSLKKVPSLHGTPISF